jgi:hypothetical protein
VEEKREEEREEKKEEKKEEREGENGNRVRIALWRRRRYR